MHTWTGAGRGLRNAVQHLRLVTFVVKPFRFVFLVSALFILSCISWNRRVTNFQHFSQELSIIKNMAVAYNCCIYTQMICFKSCKLAQNPLADQKKVPCFRHVLWSLKPRNLTNCARSPNPLRYEDQKFFFWKFYVGFFHSVDGRNPA